MQLTIRDMILTTAGVAFVLFSEARFSTFARIVDTVYFELYPIALPVLLISHAAIAMVPVGGKDKACFQANGCKWTLALFFFASVGFVTSLLHRWDFGGPMAGMANYINLVNTAIAQVIAGVVAILALRIFCAHIRFLIGYRAFQPFIAVLF